MAKGKIKVQAENIFPIIKKFLYTDQEIFLRELVSNAVDATTKLKKLSSIGEAKGDLGDLKIEININKENKTISIIDKGVGMSSEEVKQYINQVAFSGAEDFEPIKINGTIIIPIPIISPVFKLFLVVLSCSLVVFCYLDQQS